MWEVMIKQANKPEYPTLKEEIVLYTVAISDVEALKEALEEFETKFKVEIEVKLMEVEDVQKIKGR